jgi:hypothetical protein
VTHLGIVQEEKDDGGYQKSSPDEDCLDAKIGLIGTDHVWGDPLEDNAAQSTGVLPSRRRHSQACSVTAQIERCSLGPQSWSRGFTGGDETERTG